METLVECEMSVFGACFLDSDAVEETLILEPCDFQTERHRVIFEGIRGLALRGEPIDLVSMATELRDTGQINKAGGSEYLSQLVDFVPTAANVGYYIKKVKQHSHQRKFHAVLLDGVERLKAGEPLIVVLELVDRALLKFSDLSNSSGTERASVVMSHVLKAYERAIGSPGEANGLTTGFRKLDQLTSGLHSGDLFVLAARPGMGKTSLALNIAENITIRASATKPVLFFSLEMSKEQLVERLIASIADIDGASARIGKLCQLDYEKIITAAEKINRAPLFIDDTGAIKVQELRAIARRMKRKHSIELIIIDYLQLMRGAGENRTQEVGYISRSLKALAKELSVPVIALSQLNRGLEGRQNKRPVLSDLRDSGEIEQDADLVAFIYRDSVYNHNSNSEDAELILAKQRRGPLSTVPMQFKGVSTRFISSNELTDRLI